MSDAHRDEIAKLEALYEENPEGRIFTHLAEAYRKAGELDRAREVLASGLERHPEYSSAHVVLGRVLMDQDQPDEAAGEFQRVLELDAHNLIAIRSLGDLARERGDDDQALEYYNRLLDQEPSDSDVRDAVEELTGGLSVPASGTTVADADAPADANGGGDPFDTEAPHAPAADQATDSSWGDFGGGSETAFDDSEGDDAEVRTETIAQVYARQGLYDRAAEVYRELVRSRPGDEALRDRLAEMEQLAAAQSDGITEEVDAVESAPASFGLEGFESGELDTSDAEVGPMSGLEIDETDADTGLRWDATPEVAEPEHDLSDEMGVSDVPEPPEESPWVMDEGAEASTMSGLEGFETTGQEEAAVGGEEVDTVDGATAEAVWSGSDWDEEAGAGDTPHAWTEEDDDPDDSPPVREYFGGLLGWQGTDRVGEPVMSPSADAGETEHTESKPTESKLTEPESTEPESSGAAPGGGGTESPAAGEDDDDLEMFRSWLESLKQ